MTSHSTARILVIGGGPAGAVAAITLAGRGLEVTLIEGELEPRRKVGECLAPSANVMLRALGLEGRMEAEGHLPALGNRSIWGGADPVERDFLFGTRGVGWHLDRPRFEASLGEMARAAGVRWLAGHRLRDCELHGGVWRVQSGSPGASVELSSELVIDASGRAASFARRCGERPVGDDALVGWAALLSPKTAPHPPLLRDRFTMVEAVEHGWWYSALLADGSLVAAYMTDADLLPRNARWEDLLELAVHTRRRVATHGGALEATPRVRPAGSARLSNAHGPGWMAAGDAAQAYDPLSSFGISSAMGSGYYAAHAAADLLAGDLRAPHAYQAVMDQSWQHYQREHAEHYGLERRWPHSAFWRRRDPLLASHLA